MSAILLWTEIWFSLTFKKKSYIFTKKKKKLYHTWPYLVVEMSFSLNSFNFPFFPFLKNKIKNKKAQTSNINALMSEKAVGHNKFEDNNFSSFQTATKKENDTSTPRKLHFAKSKQYETSHQPWSTSSCYSF